MNYVFAGLLAVLGIFGAYEYARAEHAIADFATFKSSIANESAKAAADAQKLTAQRYEALLASQSQATKAAQISAQTATQRLTEYQKKLAGAKEKTDLGHVCANVAIPEDLIP